MIGITPEAPDLKSVFDSAPPQPIGIKQTSIEKFYDDYGAHDDRLDLVVFAAPLLSLVELQSLAEMLDGQKVNTDTSLLVCTAPAFKLKQIVWDFTEKITGSGATSRRRLFLSNARARNGTRQ